MAKEGQSGLEAITGALGRAAKGTTGRTAGAPPIELWNPPFCGDLDMRIAADGTWFYLKTPIGRPALVKLFASVLKREGDNYYLVTPVEKCGIRVEDAPFLAVEVNSEGAGTDRRLIFRTNLDEIVAAGPEHPLRIENAANGEPNPYILVRPGIEARLNRPVFYELVELADAERGESGGPFGLWSDGMFFELGDPEDDEP